MQCLGLQCGIFVFIQFMDLHAGMQMEEPPAAAAKLQTPTLMRECNGIHKGISTRLPSIYRLWHWLMIKMLWGLNSRQTTTPNQLFICSPCTHTNSCALIPFVFLIPKSSKVQQTLIFFHKWCLLSLSSSFSNPLRPPVGSRNELLMPFMVHKSVEILK